MHDAGTRRTSARAPRIVATAMLVASASVALTPPPALQAESASGRPGTPRGAQTPVTPARLLDTRSDGETVDNQTRRQGIRGADTTLEIQITGRAGVPTNARAVVLNVTATGAQANGFVTVHPCGTRPTASNLNYQPGISIPNSVTTPLSPTGTICLYTNRAVHLIADLNGYHR